MFKHCMWPIAYRNIVHWQVAIIVLASGLFIPQLRGQPVLHLKSRQVRTNADLSEHLATPMRSRDTAESHRIVQFEEPPSREQLLELEGRGARILGYVPVNGLAIKAPDRINLEGIGVRWSGRLLAADKISPAIDGSISDYYIVEFFQDVIMEIARPLARDVGLQVLDNPNLLANQLLVQGPAQAIAELAEWDQVSYIFPASDAIVNLEPVIACGGAISAYGNIGQYIATSGDGWDGPGRNAVELFYHLLKPTGKLALAAQIGEIQKAMAEWSRVAKIKFTPSTQDNAARTITILFAAGAHGDPYPFDGPGKILAHTFYPSPPNPEPLAGDLHLDDDEPWHIGWDLDLYSVALHEMGHALGLGHSDKPGAVMYPYYQKATKLTVEDIAAILTLYAAQDQPAGPSTPIPPPTPKPAIAIASPANSGPYSTTSAAVTLSGTASNASGISSVTWANSRGGQGTAIGTSNWVAGPIPLQSGVNNLIVTVTGAGGATASAALAVTSVPAPQQKDTSPPSLTIISPTLTSVSTSSQYITFTGTASDNVGVASVTCENSNGGSITALGTTDWTCKNIPLLTGSNRIMVRANDAAGNMAWRSVYVTRR